MLFHSFFFTEFLKSTAYTNLVSKYAINKLEYIFLLEDKNYLHSRSYGNNI